jgi:hypothetical protein
MHALLHLLSFILLLPSLVLASGFLVLGHAIAGGSLLQMFLRFLNDALWLMSGGVLLVAVFLLAVLIGGFFPRTRYIAAAAVAVLALASGIVLIALGSAPFSGGRELFLLPGLVSLCAGGWLAAKEWPARSRVAPAQPT